MITAPGVAVLATQLAATDRRALSQAWYSALHLAHDAPGITAAKRPATSRASTAAMHPGDARETSRATRATTIAPTGTAHAVRAGSPLEERRCTLSDAARRVERALARIARMPQPRSTHTVAVGGGRVTLLVRVDPGATRVVALCGEPLRATVERALAHARFTLAARGVAVPTR